MVSHLLVGASRIKKLNPAQRIEYFDFMASLAGKLLTLAAEARQCIAPMRKTHDVITILERDPRLLLEENIVEFILGQDLRPLNDEIVQRVEAVIVCSYDCYLSRR